MVTKEQCVQIMTMLFGPVSAKLLGQMSDDEAVKHCHEKVEAFFGADKAEEIFKNLK